MKRVLTLGGTLALCGLAWVYLFVEASAMSGMTDATAAAVPWTLTEWGYLLVMWSIMMVAMMLPSALPTIGMVERVAAGRRDRPTAADPALMTPAFVAGYLVCWTAYSAILATLQWILHGMLLVSDSMTSASPALTGGLLVVAGIFQLTPLKDRCLSECRSPISFLMSHWREGTWGAFRMGLSHGAYCVGCCWALMALLFVLGVMNLVWVAALAAVVLLEKTLPASRWATGAVGATLIGWGVAVLVAAMSP